MDIIKAVGTRLSGANAALAEQSKAWRDEALTERETRAATREAELVAREEALRSTLAELQASERARGRRKILRRLLTVLGLGVAFLAGVGVGIGGAPPPSQSNAPTAPPAAATTTAPNSPPRASASQHERDPDAAAAAGRYGTGRNFDVGRYCLDVEATSDVTFDQCIGVAALTVARQR